MSKKVCFWCDNIITVKGESLCQTCREKYNKGQKELEQIDKEYNELFGNLDCIGMIKLFKTKDQCIADLEAKLKLYEQSNKVLNDQLNKSTDHISELNEQLAEKEKALEAKESVNQMYKATLNLKDNDFSDLVRENAKLKQQLAEKDQTKTEFAIQKLKEVEKELVKQQWWHKEDKTYVIAPFQVGAIIQNIIKELQED